MVRSRLLIGPSVDECDTLMELLIRLGHYFSHLPIEKIVIPISGGLSMEAARSVVEMPTLAGGYDQRNLDRIHKLGPALRFIADDPAFLEREAITSDVLLLWTDRSTDDLDWKDIQRGYRRTRTSFLVDWNETRSDGSWFAECAYVLSSRTRQFSPDEKSRFLRRTESLEGVDRAYLLGTGPSARAALDVDMSDGVRIACNTFVLDDELMDAVRPDILTFADPIFHFGPSTYAGAFQDAVERQAECHDFTIVTVERYADLLRARMPQLADRVVGVRMNPSKAPANMDLNRQLAVHPFPNILTMLMLPLAATFATDIRLLGFDGRAPDEGYFWRHGSTVQFETELAEIQDVHPGFFKLDYLDYYSEHLRVVERLLLELESSGCSIRSLTPSFMSPLIRRGAAAPSAGDQPSPESVSEVVSIGTSASERMISLSPDWVDSFGHFGPFERVLKSAAKSIGIDHLTLTNQARVAASDHELPTFSDRSFKPFQRPLDGRSFEFELLRVLDRVVDPAIPTSCLYYTADVWHLPALMVAAHRYPSTIFVVNLMGAHTKVADAITTDDPWSASVVALLSDAIAASNGTNLVICMDTPSVASDVAVATGHELPIWPMIIVAPVDRLMDSESKVRPSARPVRVVSPTLPQLAKGFSDLTAAVQRLKGPIRARRMTFSARMVSNPLVSEGAIERLARDIENSGGDLIYGTLSDDEYVEMIRESDVIVVPYKLATFRTRTSGVILDAVAAGKPVIAARGTWAGGLIDQWGVGRTYNDGDVDGLVDAIEYSVRHVEFLSRQVLETRQEFVNGYLPERLVEFVQSFRDRSGRSPELGKVERVSRLRDGIVGTYFGREREIIRLGVDRLVEVDDAIRQRDDASDQVEYLRRAVRWKDLHLGPKAQPSREDTESTVSSLGGRDGGRGIPSSQPVRRPVRQIYEQTPNALVFERPARAVLDELALVAELVAPSTVPDGIMVDVGAHHGSAFKRFLDAGWHTIAFEPDSRHLSYLEERYAGRDRLTIDSRAVASSTGDQRTFYTSEESVGISGLHAFRDSHRASSTVETVALRDVLKGSRCDLLKIDTEGYEMEVLRGFPWERITPRVIVAEFEDAKTETLGHDTGDLIRFLEDLDYDVWISEWHPIIKYGQEHDWFRIYRSSSGSPAPESWGNLIAFDVASDPAKMAKALCSVVRSVGAPMANPPALRSVSRELQPVRPLGRAVTARRVTGRLLTRAGVPPRVLRGAMWRVRRTAGRI